MYVYVKCNRLFVIPPPRLRPPPPPPPPPLPPPVGMYGVAENRACVAVNSRDIFNYMSVEGYTYLLLLVPPCCCSALRPRGHITCDYYLYMYLPLYVCTYTTTHCLTLSLSCPFAMHVCNHTCMHLRYVVLCCVGMCL